MAVTYGSRSDPGVAVHLATSPLTIGSLVPDNEAKKAGCWNAAPSALEELLPGRSAGEPGRLALWNMQESDGLPCVVVQLTTFACGGVAIAVRIAHVLADADALVKFVGNWATAYRGERVKDADLPVFEPSLLDRNAAGRIDSQRPDQNIVAQSRALPVSRFDFWESGVNLPPALKSLTAEQLDWGKGQIMPWETWVQDVPVDHFIVYFSAKEIKRMWEDATSSAPSGTWVSRFDALLAHIWALLIRSRQLPAEAPNLMHVTLGARARTSSPPLPPTFLGSPILLTRITGAAGSDTGQLAASIRTNLTQFTPEAMAAYLHDRAFDVSAQRLWSGFLGNSNSIMTSWLDTEANQVDFFGESARLLFVDCLMPALDGIIQFIEAVDGGIKRGKWYNGEVAVTMFLRRDVMERLLGDPLLRKYRDI